MKMMINKQTKPIITTIIPTYRRPKLLERAIKSVLNQTYPHFQICVYDNASGDETASVVAKMAEKDSRIKYYCHPENLGMHNNLNFGLEHIDTLFFSILADDDLLLPNFYKNAISNLEKYPLAMFSGASTLIIENDKLIGIHPKRLKSGFYEPPNGLKHLFKTHITWTSILFRTNVIKKIGVLYSDSGVWSEFDYEFRIAREFPFYYSDEPCTIWVHHPEYKHRISDTFYQNWCALIITSGHHINSKNMYKKMRIYFLIWFLKNLTGITIQVVESCKNNVKRSAFKKNIAHILKSNKIKGVYAHIVKNYIYLLIGISFMAPFLRYLNSTYNHILSNLIYGDSDDEIEKKYGSIIDNILNKT